jgi:DNA mismatch endonuclease (patch repair protein)
MDVFGINMNATYSSGLKHDLDFWKKKIGRNHDNDKIIIEKLISLNWRVCIIWECAIKDSKIKNLPNIITSIGEWLNSQENRLEISS